MKVGEVCSLSERVTLSLRYSWEVMENIDTWKLVKEMLKFY